MEEQFLETRYWTDLTDVLWEDQGLQWDDTTAYSETTLSTPSYTELTMNSASFTESNIASVSHTELSNTDTTFTEL